MPATAQRHDLTLKLKSLRAANPVTYQAPRTSGIVLPPAQPRPDPRRDALAAKIAQQLAGRPAEATVAKVPVFKSPLPARFPLRNLFNVPTLIVSLAATVLLVGSALATMLLSGSIDMSEPEAAQPPAKQAAVLSASAVGKPMPAPTPQTPAAKDEMQIAALAPQDLSPTEHVDASAASGGIGLFGDVSEVYRPDGQPGVAFGAIYDRPESGPAVTRIPDRPAQTPDADDPAPAAEPEQPQADENAEAKWIELPVAVNLRRSPSRSAGVIGVVEKGTRLQELERQRGWVKVIDPETQETGWLYPDSKPKARRAAKQATPKEGESKPPSGPFANLLGKSAAPSQPPPMR